MGVDVEANGNGEKSAHRMIVICGPLPGAPHTGINGWSSTPYNGVADHSILWVSGYRRFRGYNGRHSCVCIETPQPEKLT